MTVLAKSCTNLVLANAGDPKMASCEHNVAWV
jgi:hypothetical protein